MPELDVTEVLLDPMFSETLVVIRSEQTVNNEGRSVLTETELSPIGVVNPENPDPVVLGQEAELNKSVLMVHAYNFRFLGPTDNHQPDKLRWQGVLYIATRVFDWSKYGTGFTAAKFEAQSPVGSSVA